MDIDLRQIEEGETRLEFDLAGSSVGLEDSVVPLEGPFELNLTLDRRADEIWVRGRVRGVARQECSRCLTEYGEKLDLDFQVFCAKVRGPRAVGARAVDEEDGGVHFHDGRVLSIDSEIREALILALPMKPLCREDCAGLCPTCGEDKNQGPCRCAREAGGAG